MPPLSFLGTQFPLIQAPMAGVQGSRLAIAVSNAGALGSLPCAMLTPQSLREELAAIRQQTSLPYNVNFFCHTPPMPVAGEQEAWLRVLKPYYNELGTDVSAVAKGPGRSPFDAAMADVLEEFRPPVVSFHFGLPSPELLVRVKSWGCMVLSSATTVDEALWLQAHGADAVIAQGLEAGGHRGHFLSNDLSLQMGTFALLPQIVQAVTIPVIAAGGIADAAGVRAARTLGASAVQLGTAFLLSHEAATSELHRRALQSPQARHTALTNIFSGRPARGIVNRIMRELAEAGRAPLDSSGHGINPACMGPSEAFHPAAPAFPGATAAIAPLRARAEAKGSSDFSPLWSGQNAHRCLVAPAAQIVESLARGLN